MFNLSNQQASTFLQRYSNYWNNATEDQQMTDHNVTCFNMKNDLNDQNS